MCVQCDVRVVGGMYLNIVVIVVCFVAYTVPFNSCFYLYIAIVKLVVLVFVNALYKSPLLLLLTQNRTMLVKVQNLEITQKHIVL